MKGVFLSSCVSLSQHGRLGPCSVRICRSLTTDHHVGRWVGSPASREIIHPWTNAQVDVPSRSKSQQLPIVSGEGSMQSLDRLSWEMRKFFVDIFHKPRRVAGWLARAYSPAARRQRARRLQLHFLISLIAWLAGWRGRTRPPLAGSERDGFNYSPSPRWPRSETIYGKKKRRAYGQHNVRVWSPSVQNS